MSSKGKRGKRKLKTVQYICYRCREINTEKMKAHAVPQRTRVKQCRICKRIGRQHIWSKNPITRKDTTG